MNEFGLFGDSKDKEYKIYMSEKMTKYLFSFNYIPNNFDGILVGPSLSDQMMDTKQIKNHKIYNLSMDGANITELKYAIDNVLKYGKIKTFIICLDPYITKNSGKKASAMNPREKYAVLGSLVNVKFYLKKYLETKKGKKSVFHDSWWGYTDLEYKKRDINSTDRIDKRLSRIEKTYKNRLHLDATAYRELKEVISKVRAKNIQIVAYYYPRPKRIFKNRYYKTEYAKYRNQIDLLLNDNKDIVIDFTENKYDYIHDNDNTYSDGVHLSRIGASKILKVLNKALNKKNRFITKGT